MAKLSDPLRGQANSIDESDGRRNLSGSHGRGNGRDWVSHGGRRISSGPEPGAKGVSRSDGPRGRATGTKRDL